MQKPIKVLIIEDHSLTRIGLTTALEENPGIKVIGEAEDGEAGVALAKKLEPDLILMDLGLPNMNGIEATKLIKGFNEDIKIIVLTSHDTENEIIRALAAGADSYCLKDITPKRLISVIENIVDGGAWLDPVIAKTVLAKIIYYNSKEEIPAPKNVVSPLTDREIEILQLLADELNNLEIAEKISVSQHTVKSHICNILQKLSVDDRTQAVAKAFRQGWIR